jgi:hypothetical protein
MIAAAAGAMLVVIQRCREMESKPRTAANLLKRFIRSLVKGSSSEAATVTGCCCCCCCDIVRGDRRRGGGEEDDDDAVDDRS